MADKNKFYSHQEHLRLHPGMYFGGTDKSALHRIVYAVLDDSVGIALEGQCNHIWLTLYPEHKISVRDNSKGLPVHKGNGKCLLELVMAAIVIPGIREIQRKYEVSGGWHGIGLSAANALAEECTVEISADGHLWRQTYREGIPHTEVIQVRPLQPDESTGTLITFRPDFTILEPNEFDYNVLLERSRELAYLIPGLTITLRDERKETVRQDEFCFPNGLSDYVAYLNQPIAVLHPPFFANDEWTIQAQWRGESTVAVDIAIQYADTMETTILGYVNTVRTSGGFHTDLVPLVLLPKINEKAGVKGIPPFTLDEILPGLTAVVSVKHPSPSFRSLSEIVLLNVDLRGIVTSVAQAALQDYDSILQKCLANRAALQK